MNSRNVGTPAQEEMGMLVRLTHDGDKDLVEPKTYAMGGTPRTIECEIREPGFVRLTALSRSWQGKSTYVKAYSVAACEPEKIVPAVTLPDDFDAFWAKARARLADVPLDLKQEKVDPLCNELHDVFKVSFSPTSTTPGPTGTCLCRKPGKRSTRDLSPSRLRASASRARISSRVA
jgi:hypothetical protein